MSDYIDPFAALDAVAKDVEFDGDAVMLPAPGESGVSFADDIASVLNSGGGAAPGSSIQANKDSNNDVPRPPVVKGKSVVEVVRPDELCLGCIGTTGTKFCILPAAECETASHKSKATGIKAGFYPFAQGANNVGTNSCLRQPFLASDNITTSVRDGILGSKASLNLIRKDFAILAVQEDKVDMKAAKEARALSDNVEMYRTPKKQKLRGELAKATGTTPYRTTSSYDFIGLALQSLGKVVDRDGPQPTEGVEKDIVTIMDYLSEQSVTLGRLASDYDDKVNLLMGLLQHSKTVDTAIGEHSDWLENEGVEPVIWDAMTTVVETVKEKYQLSDDGIKKVGNDLANFASSVSKNQKGIIERLTSICKNYNSSFMRHGQQLRRLQDEMGDLSRAFGLGRGTSPIKLSRLQESKFQPRIDFSDLDANMTSVNSDRSGGLPSVKPTSDDGANTPPAGEGHDIWNTLDDTVKRVSKLESENKLRDTKSLDEAVRLMDMVFTSSDDVENWYCSAVSEGMDSLPASGMFIDPLIALQWIGDRLIDRGEKRNSLDSLLLAKRLDIDEVQLTAIDSFSSDLPLVFTGNTKEKIVTDPTKSRLANMPTWESFHNTLTGSGLSQQISHVADMTEQAMTQGIINTFKRDGRAYTLANHMLTVSFNFIRQLLTYMTDTRNEFIGIGVGSEKDIWRLITYVVEQLFRTEFARARMEFMGNRDSTKRSSRFVMMWCSIKSVGVAQNLLKIGIKDTPRVSASYNRFVLTQSNMGKVTNLVEENKNLRTELESLKSQIKSLKTVVDNTKRTADSTASKVAQLKKSGGGNPSK